MPHVSLIVEALRARPVAVFWFAALLQATLWVLLPVVFYASPPGDLPQVLAIGREWQLGSAGGPPLAYWLAELAFNAAGGHVFGLYVLSQVCVLAAFWALFTLGRAMVGTQHAAMAVLLMGGVLAFSAPTPEFGPAVLALPLTAFALLHFWRALGQKRRSFWLALALDLGLLLLTTHWALLPIAMIAIFLVSTRDGRSALATIGPWAALVLAFVIAFPHFMWLWQAGVFAPLQPKSPAPSGLAGRMVFWPALLLGIVALHAGMIILAALASHWRVDRATAAPIIEGPQPSRLARRLVGFFALLLPLGGSLLASVFDTGGTALWAAPLVLMSGLAAVVAAGHRIAIHRQRVVGIAWLALILLPPFAIAAVHLAAPWTGLGDLETAQPAGSMGKFFTDTFRRRTGRPLPVVVGDMRAAYLVALASPDRPHVFSAAAPERTPWIKEAEVRARGAIVIWDLQGSVADPPPALRARFPDLVAEVPQSFERPVQGMLPALRIGWGMIRPSSRPQ